jgi:uracil-DNA glycosylase family 4
MLGSQDPQPSSIPLFVLGMNPGIHEDKRNLPFVGPSGRMVRETYFGGENSLASKTCIYLGNAVRCWTPLAAQPKAKHYDACWSHTAEDLELIWNAHGKQRTNILCLGVQAAKSALKSLCGSKARNFSRILDSQGLPSLCDRYSLYFTFHPAAVLRNGNLIYAVADHLSILSAAIDGQRPIPSNPRVVPARAPRTLR